MRQFHGKGLLTVLGMVTLAVLLAGCIKIPENLIKLSEIQIKHVEEYNKGVASLIASHKKDAEALVQERDNAYKELLERGGAFRKELYRLASHLLKRERIPQDDTEQRFWEKLPSQDREVIKKLEAHVNKRVEGYNKAEEAVRHIDAAQLVQFKKGNETKKIEETLEKVPKRFETLVGSINRLLMHEPFEDAKSDLLSSVENLNKKLKEQSPDVERLGADLENLIKKIEELDVTLASIKASRAAYKKKSDEVLDKLDEKLAKVKSAGDTVLQTEKDMHGAIRKLKKIEPTAHTILTSVGPLITNLGDAGVIKDTEAKKLNTLINGAAEMTKTK